MEAYSKEPPPAMAEGNFGQFRLVFVLSLGQQKYYLSTSSPNHFSEIFKYVPSSIISFNALFTSLTSVSLPFLNIKPLCEASSAVATI